MTGRDGEFRFDHVAAGEYYIFVSKAGFSSGMYGEKEPAGYGELVHVAAGQTLSGLTARLWKQPVITGFLTNKEGRAVSGGKFEIFRGQWVAGALVFRGSASVVSDDAGEFRYSGLPGRYLVRGPILPSNSAARSIPVFYPVSASLTEAEPVTIDYGNDRNGVAFSLGSDPRSRSISGVIPVADIGNRQVEVTLRPAPTRALRADIEIAKVRPDRNGAFRFSNVLPGAYLLRAVSFPAYEVRSGDPRPNSAMQGSFGSPLFLQSGLPLAPLPQGNTLWSEVLVEINDRDVRETLELRDGLTVHGELTFLGNGNRPNADALMARCVSLVPADGRALGLYPCARIEADGSFRSIGVPAGRYVLDVAQEIGDWHFVGASYGDTDLAGRAFDLSSNVSGIKLLFSPKASSLTGRVLNRDGQPVNNAIVFVVDTDQSRSRADGLGVSARVQMRRTDAVGKFDASVFSGSYAITALEGKVPKDWEAPEFLEALVRLGKRVTVGLGERSTIELRLSIR